ncbi:hypothetical protein VCR6J2_250091 [Vibrio coralliirubri]|nr:hypothetical protein VCR6J2_250091 [Vibrio coralliirubri]CDT43354.1 hypothetical protein VCR29J2_20073 [Vibrio coralliirubri]CDT66053.1 hypothetical protein VCR4J2_750437 [Vibrio coralliirubri]
MVDAVGTECTLGLIPHINRILTSIYIYGTDRCLFRNGNRRTPLINN